MVVTKEDWRNRWASVLRWVPVLLKFAFSPLTTTLSSGKGSPRSSLPEGHAFGWRSIERISGLHVYRDSRPPNRYGKADLTNKASDRAALECSAQISQGRHLAIVQTIILKTYSFHRTRKSGPGELRAVYLRIFAYIKDGGRVPGELIRGNWNLAALAKCAAGPESHFFVPFD